MASFDIDKISVAMTKAFLAVEGNQAAASSRIHETVADLSKDVLNGLARHMPDGGTFYIEDIQDQVELALMRGGHQKVARSYVLYREQRNLDREDELTVNNEKPKDIFVTANSEASEDSFDANRINTIISEACSDIDDVSPEPIKLELQKNIYDGISQKDTSIALLMSSRVLIEKEPNYTYVTARLLLDNLRTEALSFIYGEELSATASQMKDVYSDYFKKYISKASELELLDKE